MDWFLYETASITKELSKIEIAETIKQLFASACDSTNTMYDVNI